MEIEITSKNFDEEVIKSDKPVLLDFWATWCGPCRMIAGLIKDIATEFNDSLKVGKINVDEQEELADKFRISSIPTLVLIKDGKVIKTRVGYIEREQLLEFIKC